MVMAEAVLRDRDVEVEPTASGPAAEPRANQLPED